MDKWGEIVIASISSVRHIQDPRHIFRVLIYVWPYIVFVLPGTFHEAERSLQKYLSEHCDTSDLQSEAETQTSHKRKHKPNPLYTYSDSEDEQPTKKRFPQAPRVTIPDLTRAVNELREEVRAIRNTGCNESVDAGVLPLDLPLHNIEELNNAEAPLQSQEANKAMVRRFTLIGGTTLEVRVRRVMAYAITNELASVLNWAGKKTKDQTKQKRAFKDTALCKCIFDGLTQQLGANSMSEFVFAQAVQKWLRYAPDRLGGAGRTSCIPIPE
ncbi:uncharacterized protein LOC113032117 [Astatotilapia calliptera]|uniref:uncharacterized protein LOC113032117 n=1 Tax=Astatotilapia calliptera TaxID=8154 RepID=UPI000E417A31|nr:uncharacterized protein LOC113032117 [Astatotilapia calliptera]